jgi:hypothetical protein
MIIRTPTFQDYDRIMELLIDMANFNELTELQNPEYNDKYIRNLLCNCQKAGVVLVAEDNNKIEGVIIGAIMPNIWLNNVNWLREIAFWVTSTGFKHNAGVKLINAFKQRALYLLDNGIIDNFVITSLEKLPVDYEKYGFNKLETNYSWSK